MNLLSINYLHAGAPKYWYAIAPQHAKRFESLAESHFGHKARECPEFLRHKQALLSPAVLQKAGVPFEIQVQRPGDAIITCPGAYHFGVNLGFNVAEATNIAIPEWIPMGRRAKVCMCRPSSVRIDVDLFARLLQQYEHDADKARRMGFPKLSYRKWATARESEEDAPTFGAIASSSTTKIPSAISKKHPFWVEVTIPLSDRGNGRKVGQHANKRRKKQHKEEEEWRLAKPLVDIKMRRQVQKLDSKVLCLLPGRREDSDREDEQCFAGVVKEISEGFVRVHFCGLRKEDDVWMSVTSDKLFMDGGKWLPTSTEKKLWEQDQQKQIIHSGKSCRSG
jgi:jumonji domain-containing protein 2